MKNLFLSIVCAIAVTVSSAYVAFAAAPTSSYTKLNINGWTVYVSPAYKQKTRARNIIINKIKKQTAAMVADLPDKQLAGLRKGHIWVEPGRHYRVLGRYFNTKSMIYQENLNPAKLYHVEIFETFADRKYPTLMLHELAHVYHDRKLRFQSAKIKRLFNAFETQFPSAKDKCGRPVKAYALENENEFFATFTESYFNDTCGYPYNQANIRKNHPDMYAFLAKVWGVE